jgi:hypothetical protein
LYRGISPTLLVSRLAFSFLCTCCENHV